MFTPMWRLRLYFAAVGDHRPLADFCSAYIPNMSSEGYLVMRSITVLAGAAILAGGLAGPAMSQGASQTVALVKVDPQTVATGFRSSKVVGASVVRPDTE